ncbi:nagb/rpia/CoA transferase-like protein, partial [Dendrothele bispora CBS 962.96]
SVAVKLLSLPAFRQCKSVSCYLNMPTGELDTSSIVNEILSFDVFHGFSIGRLQLLPTGMWGIREPGTEYNVWLFSSLHESNHGYFSRLPGVAFDRSMARLGQGKGYYDGYITSYIATRRPRPLLGADFFLHVLIVTLALREQLLDNATSANGLVPIGEHDWKMDIIVTPDEVLHVER